MNRRAKILMGSAMVLACGVVGLLIRPGVKEPAFRGKRLSEWIDLSSSSNLVVSSEAEDAVKQIGTNGFTFLLECIRNPLTTESVRYRAAECADGLLVSANIGFRFGPLEDKKANRAIVGFRILGDQGAGAVPRLLEMAKAPKEAGQDELARICLGAIGKAAVSGYCTLLTNEDSTVRWFAIYNAYVFETNMVEIMGFLKAALNDPDPAIRSAAQEALRTGGDCAVH